MKGIFRRPSWDELPTVEGAEYTAHLALAVAVQATICAVRTHRASLKTDRVHGARCTGDRTPWLELSPGATRRWAMPILATRMRCAPPQGSALRSLVEAMALQEQPKDGVYFGRGSLTWRLSPCIVIFPVHNWCRRHSLGFRHAVCQGPFLHTRRRSLCDAFQSPTQNCDLRMPRWGNRVMEKLLYIWWPSGQIPHMVHRLHPDAGIHREHRISRSNHTRDGAGQAPVVHRTSKRGRSPSESPPQHCSIWSRPLSVAVMQNV